MNSTHVFPSIEIQEGVVGPDTVTSAELSIEVAGIQSELSIRLPAADVLTALPPLYPHPEGGFHIKLFLDNSDDVVRLCERLELARRLSAAAEQSEE